MSRSGSPRWRRSLAAMSVSALVALVNLSVSTAAPRQQGTNADTTCEVVSVGQWYCTIDGKGYYCDTDKNPDPNKNCRPARTAPSRPRLPMVPMGPTAPAVR